MTMLFTTAEERQDYFDKLETGEFVVEYGAAMAHARGVPASVWYDRNALKDDCAQLMLYEVQRYLTEQGVKHEIVLSDINHTSAFTEYFDHARTEPENELERGMVNFIAGYQPNLVKRALNSRKQAHVAVAEEIQRRFDDAGYWGMGPRKRRQEG